MGVAVIDSGIFPDHDLTTANGITSRVVYNESFVAGQGSNDAYGHGTHVAGIVGSAGRDSSGIGFKRTFKGVAPNVNLINLRVLDANGSARTCHIVDAGGLNASGRTQLLSDLKGLPVLSVSDTSGFAQDGGIVQLLVAKQENEMGEPRSAVDQDSLHFSSA